MLDTYYQFYHSLSSGRKWFYLLVVLFIFLFLSRLLINLNHLFSLLIAVIVLAWLMTSDAFQQNAEHNQESEQQNYIRSIFYLDTYDIINDDHLVRPMIFGYHLDKDPKLVDFFFKIQDYGNYNLPSFRKAIMNANNILGIENFVNHLDFSPKKAGHIYEQAELELREALNNLHSLIYGIPSTGITHYTFNNSLKELELILIQHVDNIKNLAKLKFDTCQLTNESAPIHDYFADANDQKSKGYSMNFSMY